MYDISHQRTDVIVSYTLKYKPNQELYWTGFWYHNILPMLTFDSATAFVYKPSDDVLHHVKFASSVIENDEFAKPVNIFTVRKNVDDYLLEQQPRGFDTKRVTTRIPSYFTNFHDKNSIINHVKKLINTKTDIFKPFKYSVPLL